MKTYKVTKYNKTDCAICISPCLKTLKYICEIAGPFDNVCAEYNCIACVDFFIDKGLEFVEFNY